MGKKVSGKKFVEDDEKYDKKLAKKDKKKMKTAGIATALKKSEKEEGYSSKPGVKPQKKAGKLVGGKKKV
jgi:hypothetical protein